MDTQPSIEEEWPFLLTLLPDDLEASARELGALTRKREVKSAADLLRLALVYGFCGWSLRNTALWAGEAQVAHLGAPALFQRLCQAGPWLGRLLVQMLAERAQAALPRQDGLRIVLRDATGISEPGSAGTDFRVHLSFDLGTLTMAALEVTTAQGGETLGRLPVAPGDIVIGDAGHWQRAGIAAVVAAGGEVIVRVNWHNLALTDREGTPLDLWGLLRGLAPTEVGEGEVQTAPAPEAPAPVPGRLIALRKSPQAAEAARREVRRKASKDGRTPSALALEAAEYVLRFTTLTAARLVATAVLELYRFRWQVELAFKRLKTLMHLEALPAQGDALGHTFLAAKLLGALLIEALSHRWVAFSPWGYRPPAAGVHLAGVSDDAGNAATRDWRRAHLGPMGVERRAADAGVSRHAPAQTP
jgi:DDE family transposase